MENITCSLSECRTILTFYNNCEENFFSNFAIYDNVYNLFVSEGWVSIPPFGYSNYKMGDILSNAFDDVNFKGIRISLFNDKGEEKEYIIGDNSSKENYFYYNSLNSLWELLSWKNNVYDEVFLETDVIYDLGANIGMYSLWVLEHTISKCYCFEPDPYVFNCLEKNLKKFTNTKCFNIAISDKNGFSDFGVCGIHDVGSSLNYKDNVKEWISIETINLEDWIKKNDHTPPTIIKCDIEQEEWNFLDSLSDDFIKSLRYIVVEFHCFTDDKKELHNYIIRFLDLNFSCRNIPGLHNPGYHKTLKFVNLNYK